MTPLRQRMLEDMQMRNLALRTQGCYVDCVAKFAQFHGRCPSQLGRGEVRDYLAHLSCERQASPTALRQTIAALRFVYRVTLDKADVVADKNLRFPPLFGQWVKGNKVVGFVSHMGAVAPTPSIIAGTRTQSRTWCVSFAPRRVAVGA